MLAWPPDALPDDGYNAGTLRNRYGIDQGPVQGFCLSLKVRADDDIIREPRIDRGFREVAAARRAGLTPAVA